MAGATPVEVGDDEWVAVGNVVDDEAEVGYDDNSCLPPAGVLSDTLAVPLGDNARVVQCSP